MRYILEELERIEHYQGDFLDPDRDEAKNTLQLNEPSCEPATKSDLAKSYQRNLIEVKGSLRSTETRLHTYVR